MAVKFGQNNYLDRDASFFDPTLSWTWFYFFDYATAGTPSGGQFVNYLSYGDEAFTNPYIAVRTDINTKDVKLRAWDGSTLTETSTFTPVSNVWAWIAVIYDAGTTTLTLVKNGTALDSIVVDLSTFTFVETDNLINWTSGSAAFGLFGMSSVRMWQTNLSIPELVLESASATAIKTASLLADTPLAGASNFYDISGNGEDWTPHILNLFNQFTYTVGPIFDGQSGGAIGLFGGFSRIDANNTPGLIRLTAGLAAPGNQNNTSTILWVRTSPEYLDGTWPTNPLCTISSVWVEWLENTGARQISTDVFELVSEYNPPTGGVANCDINQSVEIRFRFGTYNSGTGLHDADGYWELRINGVVQLTETNIALGLQDFQSFDLLVTGPNGGLDQPDDGGPAQTNGGLTSLYVNGTDTYGASVDSIINEVYSGLTAADLWWDVDFANPWQRWSNGAGATFPLKGDPPPNATLETDGLLGSPAYESPRVTDNTDFMSYYVTPPPLAPVELGTGIYILTGTSPNIPRVNHDNLWSAPDVTEDVAIPNPFYETFLAGDE